MNIGIICEYNPFHYGHLYHINKIKEMYPDSNIILVLSGWLTERGDLSVIDKFKKTDIALYYGVDLVVELPYKYLQSADYFAMGSIKILNELKCDILIFGSESNNLADLIEMADTQINNKEYDTIVKRLIENGINYPTAMSTALKLLCNKEINKPNDILGLCYIKEILKNDYNIKPMTIKRKGNYNSKKIEGKITSATSIRELIKNKKNYKKYLPDYSYKLTKDCIFIEDYFDIIKHKIITCNNLTIYQGIDDNLSNRIYKYINTSYTMEELLKNLKTKAYTYNRLKRALTYILFCITKEECKNLELEYIRILGFNYIGKEYLNKIKKQINIPILTKYESKYLSKDLMINNIISLNNKIKNKKEFTEKEYKQKPIIR